MNFCSLLNGKNAAIFDNFLSNMTDKIFTIRNRLFFSLQKSSHYTSAGSSDLLMAMLSTRCRYSLADIPSTFLKMREK